MKNYRLKRIIPLLLLISVFSRCNPDEVKKTNELNLAIKDKDLVNFFKGPNYYRYLGLKYKDSIYNCSFTSNNSVLSIGLNNNFIQGFQDGHILDDSLKFSLHDLSSIESVPLTINFNEYKTKQAFFLPKFTKNNLELLRNRSSLILKVGENDGMFAVYASEEYSNSIDMKLEDLVFHESSRENLAQLRLLNLYPRNLSAFFFVHNPLTGLYTCLPDIDRFTFEKTDVLDSLEVTIKYEKEVSNYRTDTFRLAGFNRLDTNLILRQRCLVIESGTTIELENNSSIIAHECEVLFEGNRTDSIKLIGRGNNSLLFRNSNVKMSFIKCENFSNYSDSSIRLPSAVTFYNSSAELQDCFFNKSLSGDDFINFYNTDFTVRNCTIANSKSDAIDSDFSRGLISGSLLVNIGNDGLDFSGSDVEIAACSFDLVGDKAISAGESTEVSIRDCHIENSELGIVVKDGSNVRVEGVEFSTTKINYAVFFKKNFYEAPSLVVDTLDTNGTNLFQQGVSIVGNDEVLFLDDVESLLYGKLYGKASK